MTVIFNDQELSLCVHVVDVLILPQCYRSATNNMIGTQTCHNNKNNLSKDENSKRETQTMIKLCFQHQNL